MDRGLISWARGVKGRAPPLWFFTDPRVGDVEAVVRRLPKGLCGVVFRDGGAALGSRVARVCRARRIALVVAGDARLAARLHAGVHLRGGRRVGVMALPDLVTASAHNAAEVARARRAGADIVFCSPVFATRSHPGAAGLGVYRFRMLMRLARPARGYGLGGIDGGNVKRLGRNCAGVGAIDAFLCTPGLRDFSARGLI